jgi:hypothetical protein
MALMSYGIRLMRSRSAFSRDGESARSRAGTLIKKNRQFLAKPVGIFYCFSEKFGQARLTRLMGGARLVLPSGAEPHYLALRSDAEHRVSKGWSSLSRPWRLLERPSRPLRGASGRGGWEFTTTREWRRKPLKSLKTDSAIRRLAVAGKENLSAEFRITALARRWVAV